MRAKQLGKGDDQSRKRDCLLNWDSRAVQSNLRKSLRKAVLPVRFITTFPSAASSILFLSPLQPPPVREEEELIHCLGEDLSWSLSPYVISYCYPGWHVLVWQNVLGMSQTRLAPPRSKGLSSPCPSGAQKSTHLWFPGSCDPSNPLSGHIGMHETQHEKGDRLTYKQNLMQLHRAEQLNTYFSK